MAERLLAHHGCVGAIFAASPDEIAPLVSEAPTAADLLDAARSVALASLKADFADAPLGHGRAVVDYLWASMAFARHEIIRALYLDAAHRLILDEIVSRGSHASAAFPMTEIVRRAVTLGASGLLLAHNHPSGNPHPSQADRTLTRSLLEKLATVEIVLHDHVIVSRSGWVSFRALGLFEDQSARFPARADR